MQIDLNKYTEFVDGVTSNASNDFKTMLASLDTLNGTFYEPEVPVNVPLLITGSMGMCGESGEFSEIVKKLIFHGKILTPEIRDHMIKELGDVIWYWTNTCRALEIDPNEVIALNVKKLESRYPGGKFSIYSSTNRAEGDI